MTNSFKEAVKHRRSIYEISNHSMLSDEEIKQIVDFAVMYVPSAFNSQSTRIVLLLKENHTKLWELTKGILQQTIPGEMFKKTEEKIDRSFASGYGTVLFFEDWTVVENLQKTYPTYKDKFPVWAEQTSAMHQFVIWTLLEEAGLGASLQHYNPLIDQAVAEEWSLDPNWKLIAEMPFGAPLSQPGPKDISSLDNRVLLFK